MTSEKRIAKSAQISLGPFFRFLGRVFKLTPSGAHHNLVDTPLGMAHGTDWTISFLRKTNRFLFTNLVAQQSPINDVME